MTDTTNYDKTIGIFMVNTDFRRFVGDIHNAETWSFPVQYRIVEETSPANVVDLEYADLLEPFKRAADELIAEGGLRHHHDMRVPLVLPARAGRALRSSRRDLKSAAGALDRAVGGGSRRHGQEPSTSQS